MSLHIKKSGYYFPLITCADGLTMSVQGSKDNYCSPRTNLPYLDDYHEVEVGFPSELVPELMPYAESPEHPTNTVASNNPPLFSPF